MERPRLVDGEMLLPRLFLCVETSMLHLRRPTSSWKATTAQAATTTAVLNSREAPAGSRATQSCWQFRIRRRIPASEVLRDCSACLPIECELYLRASADR